MRDDAARQTLDNMTFSILVERIEKLERQLCAAQSALYAMQKHTEWATSAIIAVQETLGTMPQGHANTVRERLERLEQAMTEIIDADC